MNKVTKSIQSLIAGKSFQFISFLLLAYLWTSVTSIYLAGQWGWNVEKSSPMTMRLAQIVSVPLLACILFLLARSSTLIRNNKIIFSLSLLYFFVNLALFFSVAPGCFTEDTFYTFHMVKNGWWEGWYSSLHPLLMTGLIQILPWNFNAPGIFLALLWSTVYVFAHFILSKLNAPRLIYAGLFLLIFLPAQLASSLIIVRDSYFSAIFIAFNLYIFYLLSIKKNMSTANLLALAGIGALLSLYRSEVVPSVAIGAGAVVFAYLSRNPGASIGKTVIPSIALPFLVVYFISALPPTVLDHDLVKGNTWGKRTELEYKLTLIENPLGYIVRNNGSITYGQKLNIEKVFAIEDLARYWCPGNLCLFYGGHWNKESSKNERDAAFSSALAVFVHNPRLFILSRLETLATVGDKSTQTICSGRIMQERGFSRLVGNNFMTTAGDAALRLIRDTETNEGAYGGRWVWWNVYAATLLLAIVLAFFKFAPASGVVSLVVIMRSLITFLAAPAGFTIYYTTLFIGAPLVFLLFLCEAKKNWKKSE